MTIPLKKRGNIRSLAKALNVSHATIQRFVKKGKKKRHSNAMNPTLTATNKIMRLRWCLGHVIPGTINIISRFKDMFKMVHVDEKWFFMSKTSQTFYLAPQESHPYRSSKSKFFNVKVMVETAVARSIILEDGLLFLMER